MNLYHHSICDIVTSDLPVKPISNPPFWAQDIVMPRRAVTVLSVERAADSLLRQGVKPSVAGIRDQLGGGSPNTLTPMLARYWESLGKRLQAGPESLEHVPEALARVTELFWRRAVE